MSEFKGTPGPWRVQSGFRTIYTCSDGDVGITIALAKVLAEQLVCGYGDERGTAMAEANARLIAAAPDLYDALAELLTDLTAVKGFSLNPAAPSVQKARAALRRATGEEG